MGTRGRFCAGPLLVGAVLALLAPVASAHLRGKVDPTFGKDGKVLLGPGPTYANSAYSAVARQPDGSLVLAGTTESIQGKYIESSVLVQRRLPDGQLDPGFHQVDDEHDGFGRAGLALESDGGILYTTAGEFQGDVRRLNADGTVDTSFGSDGVALVPLEPAFLAVDAEGRTVVAGAVGVGGGCHDCQASPVVAVARVLPDGALDKTFGKEGVATEGGYGKPVGLSLEADGSIIVAGAEDLFALTSGGAPDPSFGKEGTLALDRSVDVLAETTAGDLVVAGRSSKSCCEERSEFTFHAYLPDGSPDASWGSGGKLSFKIADVDGPTALAPGPQGTLVLAGETAVADEKDGCRACDFTPYVARISAGGAVDPSFSARLPEPTGAHRGVDGYRGYSSRVGAIAVLPGGGVVLAGASDPESSYVEQATATALTASGSVEASFGTAGVAADPEPLPSNTEATAFAAGPGGSLVASLRTDGAGELEGTALDAWGPDGKALPEYGGLTPLAYADPSSALQADDHGRLYRIEQEEDFVRRFDPAGHPDAGYGSGGRAQLPPHFVTKALVVRRNGTALAVGMIRERKPMALFELTPSGHPDRNFGKNGLALIRWGKGVKATAFSATFDRRGRIVVFGIHGHQTPLARLLPDGRLDPSFGGHGRVNFKPLLATDVSSISVAPDGRIYLATSPDRGGETTLVRFRADGARDRSFGKGGVVRVPHAPALIRLFVFRRQLVLVSGDGQFHSIGFALHAFRPDGRPERCFGKDGVYEGGPSVTEGFGAIGAVREPDGEIVVAGTRRPLSYGEELELLRFR